MRLRVRVCLRYGVHSECVLCVLGVLRVRVRTPHVRAHLKTRVTTCVEPLLRMSYNNSASSKRLIPNIKLTYTPGP